MLPVGGHFVVLLLQRPDTLNQFRVVAGQQAREHVALLVFVVVGGGEVEIAQDVSGSLLRLCVGTLGGDMLEQPLEQVAAFLHPFMAGVKQAGGIVKTGCGRRILRVKRFGQGYRMHGCIVADPPVKPVFPYSYWGICAGQACDMLRLVGSMPGPAHRKIGFFKRVSRAQCT